MKFETEQSRHEFWGSWVEQVGSDRRKRVITPKFLAFIRCFPVRGETVKCQLSGCKSIAMKP